MDNFECCICNERFEDPIECIKCHNNFCKKHFDEYKNECPICRVSPFQSIENYWLKRTIANLDSICKCSICEYEGDRDLFWNHLLDNHKNEIIQHFNKNHQLNQSQNNKMGNPNLNNLNENNVNYIQNKKKNNILQKIILIIKNLY